MLFIDFCLLLNCAGAHGAAIDQRDRFFNLLKSHDWSRKYRFDLSHFFFYQYFFYWTLSLILSLEMRSKSIFLCSVRFVVQCTLINESHWIHHSMRYRLQLRCTKFDICIKNKSMKRNGKWIPIALHCIESWLCGKIIHWNFFINVARE